LYDGEIEDETHFLLDCCVYEDLRQEMLDVVSSTLSREIEVGKARKDEEGRRYWQLWGESCSPQNPN